MAMQYSVAVRNARGDQTETTIGVTPILELFNGSIPANCAAADAGTKIASGTLPSDYLTNASAGVKSKNGTWTVTGLAGAGAGTAAQYFRIKESTDTTCHIQGTVTVTGGGGDMTMDNTSVANTQVATVNSFTITEGNA